ncbi:hypothetical protein ACTFIZ_007328 [Dictyostelium cf. discoideum]
MGAKVEKSNKSFISKRLEEIIDILVERFEPSIENVNMLAKSSNNTIHTYNEFCKLLIFYTNIIFRLVIFLLILLIWVQIKQIMTNPWYNYPIIFLIAIFFYFKIKT